MKEAVQHSPLQIAVRDVGIPKPAPGQILIRVVVSGTNPKDWKLPHFKIWGNDENDPKNHGDDIAGYIEAIGEGVIEFRPGERVAAFHEMASPHGSWAEYAIAWEYTTFHIPEQTSFEGKGSKLELLQKCIGGAD